MIPNKKLTSKQFFNFLWTEKKDMEVNERLRETFRFCVIIFFLLKVA